MDPALVQICDRYGVFLRREAEDLGYHDHAISSLVKTGVWHRVRHGAYRDGATWAELSDTERYALLCRAAVRQARTEVVLSHVSSANEWAAPLWDVDLSFVDLTRRDEKAGRKEAGIRQHRGVLVDGDVVEHGGLFVMSATRTALEVTTLLDIEHSMIVIDDLLHRGLTDPERLATRYALMNHWPATLHTDLILRQVDGRAESVGETRLRYLCWAQRLPAPQVNYEIRDASGRVVARVDLAWPELGVFVEFDGMMKYGRLLKDGESVKDAVVREQRREEMICGLTGWVCVRVVWADLERPVATADRIRVRFRSAAA
ncbi:type IV toxin-antitoxin system AbiEi family antitoxin domain-containing protein [Nocardioides rubriscoriae]|uniref:type IV toxin-antitoxin system AbiEi family antitoxin domain-containing protein n=1 Tax=Nocardioides rubriscoriae TaxID=642762 RepID=UPI0011DFFA00|nr:type IV toxin-antitoxin system AbiEi family antitoxin domain-containing protein [Nocardioides rubriscoriae]